MNQELQRTQGELQTIDDAPAANLLAVVARAAADPGVDVAKMEALLNMQERLMRVQAEREFKAALSAIQAVAPRVERDGKIVVKGTLRSTYATFEAIDKELRPLTDEHGFSYRFTTEQMENKTLLVIMTVGHRGGHAETATMPLPVDANEYRSAVQNVRSSITFAKRCLVSDFFNIVTVGEDTDGAGGYISEEQAMVLETMLKDKRANVKSFLAYAEAESVKTIAAKNYDKVLSALRQWGGGR